MQEDIFNRTFRLRDLEVFNGNCVTKILMTRKKCVYFQGISHLQYRRQIQKCVIGVEFLAHFRKWAIKSFSKATIRGRSTKRSIKGIQKNDDI